MISAELFLKGRGLQPAQATHEDSSSGREPKAVGHGRFRNRCDAPTTSMRVSHRHVVGERSDTRQDPSDLGACREAALRLLDAAPRSSGALRERLLGKGYMPDVIDDVIERLTRVQLLDDDAYARSAVHYCAARLMGRRGAVAELTRKGVDRTLAQRVCAEADSQGVFDDAAWELGRRTARKTVGMDPAVRRRRFWSAGGRKGHNPAILREIAQELFAEERD